MQRGALVIFSDLQVYLIYLMPKERPKHKLVLNSKLKSTDINFSSKWQYNIHSNPFIRHKIKKKAFRVFPESLLYNIHFFNSLFKQYHLSCQYFVFKPKFVYIYAGLSYFCFVQVDHVFTRSILLDGR